MKKQITILAAILIVSIAYTQERQRTQTSSQSKNQRTRSTQKSTSSSSTSSTKSNSTYRSSGTSTQHTSASSTAQNENRKTNQQSVSIQESKRKSAPASVSVQQKATRSVRTRDDHTRIVYTDTKTTSKHVNVSHQSRPVRTYVHFSPEIRHRYIKLYPHIDFSIYPIGYEVPYISAYRARYFKGQFATVYGTVLDVYYSREYDEYYLYIGQHYPRHDFSIVIPGYLAREYSRYPGNYFLNEDICITGYIDSYSGKPEMLVKANTQFNVY